MCGATEFFDEMEASMHAWWRATGVSVVSQDGAESSTPCANVSHKHHHGLNDSIWAQYIHTYKHTLTPQTQSHFYNYK